MCDDYGDFDFFYGSFGIVDLLMASEDVKRTESAAVSTIVNLAEEAKLAREGVKAPSYAVLSICKSLFAGGVAGGV